MITINKLKQAIAESMQFSTKPIIREDYLGWLKKGANNKLIKAITGFRRSGKSYLLKMLAQDLMLNNNIPIQNVFYLNFENDLLINIKTVSDLRKLWEMYLAEIAVLDMPIYIILDEIQLVSSWEKLVRTLYESGKYNIFLSGSNSKLLSGELSSSLSGRSIELTISPFSFTEYLKYLKIEYRNYYSDKNVIDQAFIKYLRRGGMAEQFELDNNHANSYRDGIIQKIILDDISKRYQVDKIRVLQNTFEFISGNITSTLSQRKIINRLHNQGINISPSTLDNYIYYWETSFALSKLHKFDYRLSRIFDRTSKYYVVDNLLISGREESDEKRLENLVYNELVRKHGKENIFFGSEQNGYEIDFVVKLDKNFIFYQVCLKLNNENYKREVGNLKLIKKYLDGKAILLTLNDNYQNKENEISTTKEITILPIVEWLTNQR